MGWLKARTGRRKAARGRHLVGNGIASSSFVLLLVLLLDPREERSRTKDEHEEEEEEGRAEEANSGGFLRCEQRGNLLTCG